MTNLDVTNAVAPHGFYYAPDPSSQQVCTIGGNVAENSGGAHCLKYGFTVNHVLAAEIVLPDGDLVELSVWDEGPDLLGVFVGSEGTLGIATTLTLRILRAPESVRTLLAGFEHTDDAGAAVSGMIAAGILPAAIEMMDAITIEAAEAAVNANYPPDCGAVLIIELDGPTGAGRSRISPASRSLRCERRASRFGSPPTRPTAPRSGAGERRPSPRWAASAPTTTCRTVSSRARSCPRFCGASTSSRASTASASATSFTRATATSTRSCSTTAASTARPSAQSCSRGRSSKRASTRAARSPASTASARDKACAMPLMFGEDDLAAMQRLRHAFDPRGLANPGKVFPTPRLCGEVPGPVPRPSTREGRACRAFLSRGSSSTSPAT